MDCHKLVLYTDGSEASLRVAREGRIVVREQLQVVFSESRVAIDGTVQGESSAILSVDAKDLAIAGTLHSFARISLTSDCLALSETGLIENSGDCSATVEWGTLAGRIRQLDEVSLDAWGLLVLGAVADRVRSIRWRSLLVAVNSEVVSSSEATDVAAPFLLSTAGKQRVEGGASVSEVVRSTRLGGPEQKELKLESIVCLVGGSTMEAASLVNNSVLSFKFLSVTRDHIPGSDSVKAWSEAMTVLEQLKSEVSTAALERAAERATSLSPSELQMREASALYVAVSKMSRDLCSKGIHTFSVPLLVEELVRANNLFKGLSLFKERLLQIEQKAKKAKRVLESGLISMKEYFGFGPDDGEKGGGLGVTERGHWSYQAGVVQTSSGYRAKFAESWSNQGLISVAGVGDLIVSAKSIRSGAGSSRVQSLLKCANDMLLLGEELAVLENLRAQNLAVEAGEQASVSKADVGEASIKSKAGRATLSDSRVAGLADLAGKKVDAESVRAGALLVEAEEDATISLSQVNEATVTAEKGKAALTDSDVSGTAVLTGRAKAQAGRVTGGTVRLEATAGAVETTGKMTVNHLAMKGEKVELCHGREGRAGHSLGTLEIETKRMSSVLDVIQGRGLYASLEVRDKLDLAVTDQHLLITEDIYGKAALSLKARSIDVRRPTHEVPFLFWRRRVQGGRPTISRDKGISFTTIEGNVTVHEANFAARMGDVQLVAEKKSIDLLAAKVEAGKNLKLKAAEDVRVRAKVTEHTRTTKTGGWFRKKVTTERWSTVEGSSLSAKTGDVDVEAEGGTVQVQSSGIAAGRNATLRANGTVKIEALKTVRSRTVKKKVLGGLLGSSRGDDEAEESHDAPVVVGGDLTVSSGGARDAEVLGTTLRVRGNVNLRGNNVVLKDHVLKRSATGSGWGFSSGRSDHGTLRSGKETVFPRFIFFFAWPCVV